MFSGGEPFYDNSCQTRPHLVQAADSTDFRKICSLGSRDIFKVLWIKFTYMAAWVESSRDLGLETKLLISWLLNPAFIKRRPSIWKETSTTSRLWKSREESSSPMAGITEGIFGAEWLWVWDWEASNMNLGFNVKTVKNRTFILDW
jgi:hypothetical protein